MVTRHLPSVVRHAPTKAGDLRVWQDQAACYPWDFKKNGDPFYPTGKTAAEAHKGQSICSGCPVRRDCKDEAMEHRDTMNYGIFGGTTPEDRQAIIRKRYRKTKTSS